LWETGVRSPVFQARWRKLWTAPFLLFFDAVHGFSTERQRQ
jgi:hypothetical protein